MPRIERQQYSLPSLKNPTAARWDFSMVEPQPPPRRGAQNARHRTGLQRAALPPSHRQQSAGSRPFSHPLLLLTVSPLYHPTKNKKSHRRSVGFFHGRTATSLPPPRRAKRAPQNGIPKGLRPFGGSPEGRALWQSPLVTGGFRRWCSA